MRGRERQRAFQSSHVETVEEAKDEAERNQYGRSAICVFVIEQRGIIVCSLTFHFPFTCPRLFERWQQTSPHLTQREFLRDIITCRQYLSLISHPPHPHPRPPLYIRHISLKKALISHSPYFPTADG